MIAYGDEILAGNVAIATSEEAGIIKAIPKTTELKRLAVNEQGEAFYEGGSGFSLITGNSPFTVPATMLVGQTPFLRINPNQTTGTTTINLPSASDMSLFFPTAEAMSKVLLQIWSLGEINIITPDALGLIAEQGNNVTVDHVGNFFLYANSAGDWRDPDATHHAGFWRETSTSISTTEPHDSPMAVNIKNGLVHQNSANYTVDRLQIPFAEIINHQEHGDTLTIPTLNLDSYTYIVDSQEKMNDLFNANLTALDRAKVYVKPQLGMEAIAYTVTATQAGTASLPKILYHMSSNGRNTLVCDPSVIIDFQSNFNHVDLFSGSGNVSAQYPSTVIGVNVHKSGTGDYCRAFAEIERGNNTYTTSEAGGSGVILNTSYYKCKDFINAISQGAENAFLDCSKLVNPNCIDGVGTSYVDCNLTSTAFVSGTGTATQQNNTFTLGADIIDLDNAGRGYTNSGYIPPLPLEITNFNTFNPDTNVNTKDLVLGQSVRIWSTQATGRPVVNGLTYHNWIGDLTLVNANNTSGIKLWKYTVQSDAPVDAESPALFIASALYVSGVKSDWQMPMNASVYPSLHDVGDLSENAATTQITTLSFGNKVLCDGVTKLYASGTAGQTLFYDADFLTFMQNNYPSNVVANVITMPKIFENDNYEVVENANGTAFKHDNGRLICRGGTGVFSSTVAAQTFPFAFKTGSSPIVTDIYVQDTGGANSNRVFNFYINGSTNYLFSEGITETGFNATMSIAISNLEPRYTVEGIWKTYTEKYKYMRIK